MLQAAFYFCNVLLFVGSFYPTFYQGPRVFARFLSEFKYSVSLAVKEGYLQRVGSTGKNCRAHLVKTILSTEFASIVVEYPNFR